MKYFYCFLAGALALILLGAGFETTPGRGGGGSGTATNLSGAALAQMNSKQDKSNGWSVNEFATNFQVLNNATNFAIRNAAGVIMASFGYNNTEIKFPQVGTASMLRLDGSDTLSTVTIGSGVSFDGETLSVGTSDADFTGTGHIVRSNSPTISSLTVVGGLTTTNVVVNGNGVNGVIQLGGPVAGSAIISNFLANSNLSLQAGAATLSKVYVTPGGVGIGTATPGFPLTVTGNSSNSGYVFGNAGVFVGTGQNIGDPARGTLRWAGPNHIALGQNILGFDPTASGGSTAVIIGHGLNTNGFASSSSAPGGTGSIIASNAVLKGDLVSEKMSSIPTNSAKNTQITNAFVMDQYFTNTTGGRLWCSVDFNLTRGGVAGTDIARVELWLDDNADGTYEVTRTNRADGGVLAALDTQPRVWMMNTGSICLLTNTSIGTGAAAIATRSSEKRIQ